MAPPAPLARRLVALLAISLAAGCTGGGATPPPNVPRPGAPVVVVSVDTLRADRLPAYGSATVSTPAIDALRADSVLFENAYTHCPLTLPAHASLFTGLLPPRHGVRNNIGYRLDGAHATLAARLKGRGYATGAAVSAWVLRRSSGLDHGFDFYDEVATAAGARTAGEVQRPGLETVHRALDWLASVGDRPPFLFVHLYEPHAPYAPPEPWATQYGDTYEGEVAAADDAVGVFLAGLRARGLYDPALIVLLSDHGEGLGDHGEDEHGVLLYREALHVPLLVKLPGAERSGTKEAAPAGLVDVAATIAAIVGLQPLPGADGRDLLDAGGHDTAAVYSETWYPRIHMGWSELHSLIDARYHFIDGPRPELYDVGRDAGERHDRASAEADRARSMKARLDGQKGSFTAPSSVSREDWERLAALGYLGDGPTSGPPGEDRPNPRDHISVYREVRAALALADAGRDEEAVQVLDRVLEAHPGFVDARVERAAARGRLGLYREAEADYLQAIEVAPTLSAPLSVTLGRVHLEMGRFAEAATAARRALEAEPGPAHELLASVALAEGDLDTAEREARDVTGDAGAEARAAVVLAEVTARRGRLPEALRQLEVAGRRDRALDLGPVPYHEFVRGDVLARLGRHAEAEAALRAEIRAFPRHARAYASLAIVCALQGRPRRECRRIVADMHRAVPAPRTAVLAARALAFIGDDEGAASWRRRAGGSGAGEASTTHPHGRS